MQPCELSIRDQENDLFNIWKKNRPKFVSDGIVDEGEFSKSAIRMLFILKEVNDEGGGYWDLRDYIAGKIADGPREQTWKAVSKWIHGISKLPNIDDWQCISKIEYGALKTNLRQIIAVNMNKSPGGSTSNNNKLWNEGDQDIKYFRKQMYIYKVHLTICCGATPFWYLVKVLGGMVQIKYSKRGIQYFIHNNLGVVVKFNHPEARVGDNLLYYGLMDFINEIGITSENS